MGLSEHVNRMLSNDVKQLKHQLNTAEWENVKLRREKSQLEAKLVRVLLSNVVRAEQLEASQLENEKLREELEGTVHVDVSRPPLRSRTRSW